GGNEMVEQRIAAIKDSDLAFQRKWVDAAIEADYHLSMAKQSPTIPVSLVHPQQTMERFVLWAASGRGKEMMEWHRSLIESEK
ncbi:MAG: hypothetical protein WCP53_11010, partial [Verrucomicrobiota bacterium]